MNNKNDNITNENKPDLNSILNGTMEPIPSNEKVVEVPSEVGTDIPSVPVMENVETSTPVESPTPMVMPNTPTVENTETVSTPVSVVGEVPIAPVMENVETSVPVESPTPMVMPNIPPMENTEAVSTNTPVENSVPVVDVIPGTPMIENIETVPTSAPVESPTPVIDVIPGTPTMENMGAPVVNSMPAVENTPNIPVVDNGGVVSTNEPVMEQVPVIDNGLNSDFNAVPVPPILETDKTKPKGKGVDKKIIVLFLIVVLITLIGFGVYYFLLDSKQKVTTTFELSDITIELGSSIPTNVNDYASGVNDSCVLDTSQVNSNKVSTYKYTIKCGDVLKEGTVIVDDKTNPEVVLTDVIVLPNASIKPEDFVEQCIDNSSCTFKFSNDYQNITKTVGEYDVEIVASDSYNNETKKTAKLVVSLNAPVKYLNCVSEAKEVDGANFVDTFKIGIDKQNMFYNAVRISNFTYSDENSYSKAVNSFDKSVGINNIIGTESFSKSTKTISLKSNRTFEELENDVNGSLEKSEGLLSAYMNFIGYTCK